MILEHQLKVRIQYSDTDQMGIMHHSNYLKHYENARWELFRQHGFSYNELERMGYLMPVIQINMAYKKSVRYDDEIMIKTQMTISQSAKIEFHYQMLNQNNDIVNTAQIVTAITNTDSKPCRFPAFLIDVFSNRKEYMQ